MEIPIIGSIDSLMMAAAMALGGCPQTWRRPVILWFMAFDFVASLIGWSSGVSHWSIVMFVLAFACPVLYVARKRPALYLLLPVIGSADNLLMGSGDGPMQVWPAAAAAIATGILALVGFSLSNLLEPRIQGATR